MKDDDIAMGLEWTARRSGASLHDQDVRGDFEVDYARIVHSSSFRRLQGKTQILALGDDDFYRTRLTHSLEVAQVAGGIAQSLLARGPEEKAVTLLDAPGLFAAISLAHDLGHPPFGHGGELALNECMREYGGFEGNAQTLRLLARLECFSATGFGADLTRRALLGVLKYPVARSMVYANGIAGPPKAYYDADGEIVSWILAPFASCDVVAMTRVETAGGGHARSTHKSFDCSLMDLADDVAYGVHDLEDAIELGLVAPSAFRELVGQSVAGHFAETLSARSLDGVTTYDGFVDALFGTDGARKRATGRLVHYFIRGARVVDNDAFTHPLLRYRVSLRRPAMDLLEALQKLVVREVIDAARVQQLEFKGRRMVKAVFDAFASDPQRLLPGHVRRRANQSDGVARVIADHVASMTDATLLKTYERLFSPRSGSVFDRI